jgi:acyl-CoA reductase-like NAD-dependent aldehyde dehydrogenase
MEIINPATGEAIASVNEDTMESIVVKFNALRASFSTWRKTSIKERIACMITFSNLLEKNIDQLSKILTSEVGKPIQQSINEINGARARIQWLTQNVEKYLADEVMSSDGTMEERISYEPLGVICNISAWNYPYLVGINVFVPALLAGNTVMYKPSEHSILTGQAIESLIHESGIPGDVFCIAIGAGGVGEMLLEQPFDGYFFTGSYKTGKYIYEKVAGRMVPCQLELGGKDPLYVCDDITDVKAVAAATADGAFYNNGQSCCAVERIYVHERVYDAFTDAFLAEVKSFNIGNPATDGVYIGPLCRKEQVNVLRLQVDDAKNKGARVATGGNPMEGKGYYFEPTVILDATHDMDVMRDESFGPIIGIMKVEDDNQAVHFMQDTSYGLTASVYSNDKSRAERILKEINAGTGYWNCCDRVSAALPWSGRNNSGFGTTLSHIGIRAFAKPKAYHMKNG